MKDVHGKEIQLGDTLRRIVEAPGSKVGLVYTVLQYDWRTGEAGEDLVASAGHVKHLLWPERTKEFEIVE